MDKTVVMEAFLEIQSILFCSSSGIKMAERNSRKSWVVSLCTLLCKVPFCHDRDQRSEKLLDLSQTGGSLSSGRVTLSVPFRATIG